MKQCWIMLVLVMLLVPGALGAQDDKDKENPAHEQLRKLKAQLVEAVNKNDYDAVMTHLDKDVVVTWMDGRVSKGPKGVREYIDKMTKAADAPVKSFKTNPTVDDLTHLYGNTGVAYGSSDDVFQMTDGSDFTIKTRWTATVVKDGDSWKIASLHASTNVFDNPVLWLIVRRLSYWVGGIAAGVGLILGLLVAWFFRKRAA